MARKALRDTSRHVALLRGINVGGKNMLPMKTLEALFAAAGAREVSTYIQSGNVAFTAEAERAAKIASEVSRSIQKKLALNVPIVLRSAAELEAVVTRNPFLAAGADLESLHVAFLAEAPGKRQAAALDPGRSPGDSFTLRGRDLYLSLPNGVARTKLTNAYFDATLATTSTIRNWRTVLKLREMTTESA
jgi:uncharacterized protein (DUF1697 family)